MLAFGVGQVHEIVIVGVGVVAVPGLVPVKEVGLILLVGTERVALLVATEGHETVLFAVRWVVVEVERGLVEFEHESMTNMGKVSIVANGEDALIGFSLTDIAQVLCTYCGLGFVGRGMGGNRVLP